MEVRLIVKLDESITSGSSCFIISDNAHTSDVAKGLEGLSQDFLIS